MGDSKEEDVANKLMRTTTSKASGGGVRHTMDGFNYIIKSRNSKCFTKSDKKKSSKEGSKEESSKEKSSKEKK